MKNSQKKTYQNIERRMGASPYSLLSIALNFVAATALFLFTSNNSTYATKYRENQPLEYQSNFK